MKQLLLILPPLLLFLSWTLWNGSVPRFLRRLGARPALHLPVWAELRQRLERLAREQRLPPPRLWLIHDFSPNALVLRSGQQVEIILSEGLLRVLDDPEIDAVLLLCLAHGNSRWRRLQSWFCLQLFPVASWMHGLPDLLQLFFSSWILGLLRLVSSPQAVLRADRRLGDPLLAAAALQKLAVLGRKLSFSTWNFAIDPLFLISPLVLDGGPFWVFLSQPPLERRRAELLTRR